MKKRSDQGSATVIVLILAALSVVLCGVVAQVAAVAAARVKASTAADLAALAAARHTDCSAAPDVALSNGAELITCQVTGMDVIVDVRVPVKVAGKPRFVTALSRAGPP